MEFQFLDQCSNLVSLLIQSQQKGTIRINIGNFNFEFSNEVPVVSRKYSPSQQKRNDERRASFETKKIFSNIGTCKERKTSSVGTETQTGINSVDNESQTVHPFSTRTDIIVEAGSDENSRGLEINENRIEEPSADPATLCHDDIESVFEDQHGGHQSSLGKKNYDVVYEMIRQSTDEAGINRDLMINQVRTKMSIDEMEDAIDFLTNEGHIYSTRDEDHFRITDGD